MGGTRARGREEGEEARERLRGVIVETARAKIGTLSSADEAAIVAFDDLDLRTLDRLTAVLVALAAARTPAEGPSRAGHPLTQPRDATRLAKISQISATGWAGRLSAPSWCAVICSPRSPRGSRHGTRMRPGRRWRARQVLRAWCGGGSNGSDRRDAGERDVSADR
jgi:hypothetical protein